MYFLMTISTSIYLLVIPCLFILDKITISELLTFIAIIPLAAIAIFQEQLKRQFFAPKLKIDFELGAPFCSKTPFYFYFQDDTEGKYEVSTEAFAFRFGVRNTGKSQAKYCEVILTELLEKKDEKWVNVEYFQQVHLKWDKGDSDKQYANINPSPIRTLCLIGHIYKPAKGLPVDKSNKFDLSLLYRRGGYQPEHLASNKKYRIKVTVGAENAPAVYQKFEIYWSGAWQDEPDDMFKEINIKML